MKSYGMRILFIIHLLKLFDQGRTLEAAEDNSETGNALQENIDIESTAMEDLEDDEIVDDRLFEGDIILDEEDVKNGFDYVDYLAGNNVRWPRGVIPYVISSKFGESTRLQIKQAMKELGDKTCVKFVPRKDEKTYGNIKQAAKGKGCSSQVGRKEGVREMYVSKGCPYRT